MIYLSMNPLARHYKCFLHNQEIYYITHNLFIISLKKYMVYIVIDVLLQ
jgi:hypothetical protein